MRKLGLFLLILVLSVSLVSCGSDEKKEEAKKFEFGKVVDGSYYNDFADFGIELDSDWTFYTDEQIVELNGLNDLNEEETEKKIKSASIIVDMMAINKNSDNISFLFEKTDSVTITHTEMDKILDNALDGIRSSSEDNGITDVTESKEILTLLEREVGCIHISGNVVNASSEVIKIFQTQLYFKCEGYICCIGITTYGEDRAEDIVSLLYKAEKTEETDETTEVSESVVESEVTDTNETVSSETVSDSIETVIIPDATENVSLELETKELETMSSDLEHSDYYIPEIDLDTISMYFNEVVLDAEFSENDSKYLVQKWVTPIKYQIKGQPTDEDYAVFNKFCTFLNGIEGFPGIYESTDDTCNLRIMFGTADEIIAVKGEEFSGNDGYITFWYDGNNELYDAEIFYCNEVDQFVRNSVIIEELYNGMGPMQDTTLREDSIIYSEYSTPQELTTVDEIILRLLYHPDIKCGMNADECYEVIKKLYY